MSRVLLASVSMFSIAAGTLPAIAQDVTRLEEIIINATKRVQDAFEVPATITTVDAETLKDRNIVSLGQLDEIFADTSIKPRSSRAYTNVTIRGQSSVDFYNPSVQVYVDGLPQDAATLGQLLPGGLERVELLYGPQGTLYGRGAVGGVINVVTRRPDDEQRLETTGAVHNLGGDAAVLVNAPLIDGSVFGDLAFTYRREADEYAVLGSGAEIGGSEDWNGRGRLRYAPEGSPLDIMVTFQRGGLDSTEEQFVPEALVERRQALPVPSSYSLDTAGFALDASYDLGFATITALTGYQDRDLDRTIFGSYTPEAQRTWSQELRIASNPDHGGAIDYVAGLYVQRLDFERRIPAIGMISEQTIDSYAAFADLTWHASERLDINPGIRFDYETVDAHAQGGVSLDDSDSFSAVSPKLGATYALTDDWRAYGLFSTGFKAGGFTRTLTPANIAFTYEPQQTYNGEVGIKYRAPDGWLEGSLAAYYNVTTDYQMFVGVQPVQYLQNVGEVTAKGVDLSVTARPTDRLEVSAAVGYNHTTFTDYSNPVTPGVDRTGNTVPYAPELTGNLSLAYTFDLADGWGQLTPRLGMTYASEIFFDETNKIGQGDVTLVDLGVKWRVNDKVVADAFVNNVFDETYAVYGFQFPQYGNLYQLGSGRAYGGRISFAF